MGRGEGRKRSRAEPSERAAAAFMDICAIYDEAVRRSTLFHDDGDGDGSRRREASVCVTCPSRSKIPSAVVRRSVEECCLSETILAGAAARFPLKRAFCAGEKRDEETIGPL